MKVLSVAAVVALTALSSGAHATFMEWKLDSSVFQYTTDVNGNEVAAYPNADRWITKIIYNDKKPDTAYQVQIYDEQGDLFLLSTIWEPAFKAEFTDVSRGVYSLSSPLVNVCHPVTGNCGGDFRIRDIYLNEHGKRNPSLNSELLYGVSDIYYRDQFAPHNPYGITHSILESVVIEHKEAAVPEPTTLGLTAVGLFALAISRKRKSLSA
jgi:hypothetical protein